MSANVNLASGSSVDLFRLRTAANGAIIKAFVATNGTLQVRSDFASHHPHHHHGARHRLAQRRAVRHRRDPPPRWNLYRDGMQIVTNWVADTGTTPVGADPDRRHGRQDLHGQLRPRGPRHRAGRRRDRRHDRSERPRPPAGTSPSAGSIQISWAASTDPAPASLPITYRIYRDGGATSVGSTTTTSFTDTGLASGSSHTYTVDAVDAANNVSAKSQASLSITVCRCRRHDASERPGAARRHEPDRPARSRSRWAASTDPAPASLPITYRIYRDGGATSIGSTTTTSFTDTGLVAGSSHTYTVDAVDAANNASDKSQASASIIVSTSVSGGQPKPGHTRLATGRRRGPTSRGSPPVRSRTSSTSATASSSPAPSPRSRTTPATNTTSYNQPLPRVVQHRHRPGRHRPSGPTFDGGGVTEVEASPDGTKLFVVGTLQHRQRRHQAQGRLASTRPPAP